MAAIRLRMESENAVMESGTAGMKVLDDRADSAPLRVWLVDDSENFRVLLAAMLEDEGGLQCEREFGSAEAVLRALETDAPDVILLDNSMPGMGGKAAVRPIRQLAPHTRILMLTTFAAPEVRAEVLRDGASDFLLKSFQINEIAGRIRDSMSRPVPVVTEARAANFKAVERRPVGESLAEMNSRGVQSGCVHRTTDEPGFPISRWLRGVFRFLRLKGRMQFGAIAYSPFKG